MNEHDFARLVSNDGTPCPLKGASITGKIDDVVSIFTVQQTYTNEGKKPIEALYTFPMPLQAVLLEMGAQFGEKDLKGHVQPNAKAENTYNEAIADGNAAILLKEVEPGLYHASLGNLKPGETAVIKYRYGIQHTWNDRFLRIHLPTTIAPRYGDHGKAGISDSAAPVYTNMAESAWTFAISVTGNLAKCAVNCPSHIMRTSIKEDGLGISFATMPDRDVVLEFESPERPQSFAVAGRDLDGWLVAADFMPRFEQAERGALNLDILIDCSGSMGGESIAQAREGLRLILDSLQGNDCFNITAFGSSYSSLFKKRLPASSDNLGKAREFLRKMDADMGGTEAEAALEHVYKLKGGEGVRSILFITDGEIWSAEKLYENARDSGCRIMTVGVGSAVSEKTVRKLAESTGGQCEIVSPSEDMARRIHRHCMRMNCAITDRATVVAEGSNLIFPERPQAIFDGDTLHVFAKYSELPSGEVRLNASVAGKNFSWSCKVPEIQPEQADTALSDLARIAVASQLAKMKEKDQGQQLALDYQLLSKWTSYILVDERSEEEKAEDLPVTVKVPQMLAHGYGAMPRLSLDFGGGAGVLACAMSAPILGRKALYEDASFEMPQFLRTLSSNTDDAADETALPDGIGAFVRKYSKNCALARSKRKAMSTLADLKALGLPADLADSLAGLVDESLPEETIVAILMAFMQEQYPELFAAEAEAWVSRCLDRLVVSAEQKNKVAATYNSWTGKAI